MTTFKSNAAYQRRQGGLSENQAKLLANSTKLLDIDALEKLILNKKAGRANILEIGFGTGDYLVQQAKENPLADFFGIDLYLLGVSSVLQRAEQDSLTNLWAMTVDAYLFLTSPPDTLLHSFNKINIFHPDPWPKKRHHKRRLLNCDTLKGAYQLLHPGGSIEILSDEASYTESIISDTLQCFCDNHAVTNSVPPQTKYGRKAIQEGRTITRIVISKQETA